MASKIASPALLELGVYFGITCRGTSWLCKRQPAGCKHLGWSGVDRQVVSCIDKRRKGSSFVGMVIDKRKEAEKINKKHNTNMLGAPTRRGWAMGARRVSSAGGPDPSKVSTTCCAGGPDLLLVSCDEMAGEGRSERVLL